MATFTVTTTATSGAGSLYRALLDAAENGVHTADTIVFGAGMSNETFHAGQTLTLSQDVTIDGDIGNDGNADVTISGGGAGHDLADFSDMSKSVELTLKGKKDATVKRGGAADDKVRDFESVTGGMAGDKLTGDKQANLLSGEKGSDTLVGGKGIDTLKGGLGMDKLTGGKDSAEYVVFDTKLSAGNADIITDFKHGIDKIVLATSIFGKLGPSVEAVELVIGNGSKPLAAKQAGDHLLYNKKTGQLFYDDDGKGKHAAVLVATFDKLPGGGFGPYGFPDRLAHAFRSQQGHNP
jgi:Ca2+-binding RTX toxin-like protein